ncbi:Rho guanine nucleotide exchange factor 2 [Manis javanica]|nr:Rho guanine nucleotide exchange factor 2 [Manis javanica]
MHLRKGFLKAIFKQRLKGYLKRLHFVQDKGGGLFMLFQLAEITHFPIWEINGLALSLITLKPNDLFRNVSQTTMRYFGNLCSGLGMTI